MASPSSALMKICTSCGLQKPLTAFLQMTGEQGRTYGNICSSCRKIDAEKSRAKKTEAEGGTTSESSKGIRSKDKVYSDIEKQLLRHDAEERHYEERDEKEETLLNKVQRTLATAEKAKNERESTKKVSSFLDAARKPIQPQDDRSPEAVATRESRTDFTAPFEDTRVAGKISLTQNVFRQAFLTQNRGVAAQARNMQTPPQTAQTKSQQATEKKEVAKDPLIEQAEKNWGPSRRR